MYINEFMSEVNFCVIFYYVCEKIDESNILYDLLNKWIISIIALCVL